MFAYGNPALRQFGDLDILVRRVDVRRTGELLQARGYRRWLELDLTAAQETSFLQAQSEYTLSRDDCVTVDLHWRLTPEWFSFTFDLERLWQRLQWVSLGGSSIRTLSSEDLLLVLCAHGTKHRWERLAWIADVAALIRAQPAIEWQWATEEARRLGGGRMLFLGLLLAIELGGASIPSPIVRLARADSYAVALAAEVRDRFLHEAWRPPRIFEAVGFHLRTSEALADRSRYVARRAFSPSVGDFTFLPLPAALSFLYYVLRPFRLAMRYAFMPLFRLVLRAVPLFA